MKLAVERRPRDPSASSDPKLPFAFPFAEVQRSHDVVRQTGSRIEHPDVTTIENRETTVRPGQNDCAPVELRGENRLDPAIWKARRTSQPAVSPHPETLSIHADPESSPLVEPLLRQRNDRSGRQPRVERRPSSATVFHKAVLGACQYPPLVRLDQREYRALGKDVSPCAPLESSQPMGGSDPPGAIRPGARFQERNHRAVRKAFARTDRTPAAEPNDGDPAECPGVNLLRCVPVGPDEKVEHEVVPQTVADVQ